MKSIRYLLPFLFLIFVFEIGFSQNIRSFLEPADTLQIPRRNWVIGSEVVLGTSTLIGLGTVWYDDYPKSDFHFINDNAEWLQMDKVGHVFSSYHIGRFGAELLQWSGANKKSQLVYGATLGFAFLTVVEVFDGYSAEWGASWGDVIANASGTALYVSQELLWKEQRIMPKFSFHYSSYAAGRPSVLGGSRGEQIMKDYNGQTYWLSVNMHSFAKVSKIPKWLNVAAGYGAEGMITGKDQLVNTVFFPEKTRIRQFYLSLDIDLSKIETKSNTLKTLFSIFNTIKIPAPTVEINERGKANWYLFYF